MFLNSKHLHHRFELQISLPAEYETSQAAYGVVYCLDASFMGGTLKKTTRSLQQAREMPPVITVGIDLATASREEWFAQRSFIMTPTKSDGYQELGVQAEWTGGAPVFLQTLAQEIIPRIETTYRVKPGERTLIGHSFGGLFALFALFEAPQLFNRYLISSPSLDWDKRVVFRQESEYAKTHQDLPAGVFLAAGALENVPEDPVVDQLQELAGVLRQRKFARLELTTMVFENENHRSVPPVACDQGLRVLYAGS